MKNKKENKLFLAGMFGMMLAFGMAFIGCDNGSTDLNPEYEEKNPFKGTWVSSEGYTSIWDDLSWQIAQYKDGVGLKGTYTYSGNAATVVYTEISNDGVNWRAITYAEASNYTNTAIVSGNKLTWGATTYTKR
ncbi:hypothetical protein FACS1894200_00190 [Spirochaetia bacterium]|nr:hypothetical protein FACS1894200_00190 [Spirochaetia bacterium]